MYKFPKIQSWQHVCKYAHRDSLIADPHFQEVSYSGTIKLHGTNCSVVCQPEGLVAAWFKDQIRKGEA
jgi:hypothetical protein